MPRRVHIDVIPKTPGGQHMERDKVYADEIEVDSEITIKSSLLRECKPGNPWFEEGESEEDDRPKFVARKSTDLRKIHSDKDRVEAILSSPMVDARPRRLSYSKSFTEGVTRSDGMKTPLRLPEYKDLVSSTSRRLSRIILSRRCSLLDSERSSFLSPEKLKEPTLLNLTVDSKTTEHDASHSVPPPDEKENILPSVVQTPSQTVSPVRTTTEQNDPTSISEFRVLADVETARLVSLCGDWNGVLAEEIDNIPEVAVDSIRATVGKCQLLLDKKLPFFKSLIDLSERSGDTSIQNNSELAPQPKADLNDLLGYWSLVADEIKRADDAFERLRIWRDEFKWAIDQQPITPIRPQLQRNPLNRHRPGKNIKRVMVNLKERPKTPLSKAPNKLLNPDEVDLSTASKIGHVIKESKKAHGISVSGKSKFAQFLDARRAALANNTDQVHQENILETLSPLGLRLVKKN